jgi:6-phosphogluconolactonase
MARDPLRIEILPDPEAVAEAAADLIAAEAVAAVAARGRFIAAFSGGSTPWIMLRALAKRDLPWASIHVLQVDERVAGNDDRDRNLTHLRESLLARAPLPSANVHPMPVEASDLRAAAAEYAATLRSIAGSPPIIDLVHLGLGADGHTASLVPGDPVLGRGDADVAISGPYQGRLRMTLTYPVIDRTRRIVFVVTGNDKADALRRLQAGDAAIPAGRVSRRQAMVLADRSAASALASMPGEEP